MIAIAPATKKPKESFAVAEPLSPSTSTFCVPNRFTILKADNEFVLVIDFNKVSLKYIDKVASLLDFALINKVSPNSFFIASY